MKTLLLLFALSLFVLLNATHSAFNPIRLPTADVGVKSDTPVLDTDGDPVQPGNLYTISSITWGAGAGEVKLGWLDSSNKCPTDVLSTTREAGTPVIIMPADANETVVLPSTYQSFTFSGFPIINLCMSSLSWRVRYDSVSRQYFLRAGKFVNNLSDRFKIERVESLLIAYKITYCPFGTDKCYNVGRVSDPLASATRLALTDTPFVLVFKKTSS